VIVRTTCRSGMRIESEADCVVLGDVNPGAEIVATGDIIVFGRLRGIAHAGSRGDRTARIWAMSIEPSQIRIAELVAVSPRDSAKRSGRFEMAEIQGDAIQVTTHAVRGIRGRGSTTTKVHITKSAKDESTKVEMERHAGNE
jgi:septum site-determining protein MinC